MPQLRLLLSPLSLLPLLSLIASLALPVAASAQARADTRATARQDLGALQQVAERFLLEQAAVLSGTASVKMTPPDNRLQLARCDAPEPYLASGAKLLGKTTVGVRCTSPAAWNVFLPATVSVTVSYVASATALAQGQRLNAADLTLKQGDLAVLPAGVLTELAQAQGRSLQLAVAAGTPLVRSMLKTVILVQPGQPVRLVAQGNGFSVTAEGRAINAGGEGDLVQARTASGQVIGGFVQADGSLMVKY